MNELFTAVREECTPAEWSRGVELSRQDAVTLIRESEEDIELRVMLKGGMSSALVNLYPEDEDWSCDCAKQDEAQRHNNMKVLLHKHGTTQEKAPDAPEEPQSAEQGNANRFYVDG